MLFYAWTVQVLSLKVLSKRNTEVSWADYARAVVAPNLIKILRVLVGNSARIGNIVDIDSGAPAVGFKAEDGVRYVVVALTQLFCYSFLQAYMIIICVVANPFSSGLAE